MLLWLAQDRGLKWHTTVSDSGDALRSARQTVDPGGRHGRDHWHVFHTWSQLQHRLGRRVLAVVVLDREGVQAAPRRQQDLTAVLELLSELLSVAPSAVQADLKRLHTHMRAQAALLTFVAPLDVVQQAMRPVVGADGLALIAWAWLRRTILAWDVV